MAKLYLGNELIIDPDVKLEKVELTQAQYNALTTKDPNKLYIITDATDTLGQSLYGLLASSDTISVQKPATAEEIYTTPITLNLEVDAQRQSLIDLYKAITIPYGGYSNGFDLGDLGGLDSKQASNIIANAIRLNIGLTTDLTSFFTNSHADVLYIPIPKGQNINLENTFTQNKNIKYIYFGEFEAKTAEGEIVISITGDIRSTFYQCLNLETIHGILDFSNFTHPDEFASTFGACPKLVNFKIKNLKTNINLSETNISENSLMYLIMNCDSSVDKIITLTAYQIDNLITPTISTQAADKKITFTAA